MPVPVTLSKATFKSKIDRYVNKAVELTGAEEIADGDKAGEFAQDLFGDKTTTSSINAKLAAKTKIELTDYTSIDQAVKFLLSNKIIFPSQTINTVSRLLNSLPLGEQLVLQKAVSNEETGKECENLAELIEEFNKSTILKDYLRLRGPIIQEEEWKPESIKVNDAGLSLIKANPGAASVIMEFRKAQNKLNEARIVRFRSSILGPLVPLPFGVLAGGGNLDPLMPVDMRGAGPMIADMRAGSSGGFALGTVAYPTQWRPVSDSTFISNGLKMSLAQVTSALTEKGVNVDDDVKNNVNKVVDDLEKAEKAVKANRDVLTKYNNLLSSGEVTARRGEKVDINEMTQIVDQYNTSMKAKNKSEVKILRVLAVLASRLY
jgi:hypothetical protein